MDGGAVGVHQWKIEITRKVKGYMDVTQSGAC